MTAQPYRSTRIRLLLVSTARAESSDRTVDSGSAIGKPGPGEFYSEPSGTIPDRAAGESGEQNAETVVDRMHAGISRSIQGTASWMDSFFGDWRYSSELNESYVRFRYNVFLEEDAKMYRKPDLQARIVLPQLRQRTHIVFAGTPRETSEFSPVYGNSPYEQIAGPDERNVSAALHQTFLDTAKQNFSIRAGAKVHHDGLELVAGPRYRVLFDLDSWNIRLTEEALWNNTSDWEARSILDVERSLPSGLFFRASNEWVWVEHVIGYVYAVSFTVGQPLSRKRAIDYEWVNIFHTQPVNELVETTVRVRYRQRIWRDWFFFEIAPQYRFPRDRKFQSIPGVLFRLEMQFGDYQ